MSGRDNPISVRSKRRITDSLLELMKEQPFAKISIKDIVDRAGLTRQTFYHNFTSKEEVLLHREEELCDAFFAYLKEHPMKNWEDFIWFYFRYWQTNAEFVQLLIDNELVYVLKMQYPKYMERVDELLSFSSLELPPQEQKYYYSFVSGAVVSILVSWVGSGMVTPAREMATLVIHILTGSVGYPDLREMG